MHTSLAYGLDDPVNYSTSVWESLLDGGVSAAVTFRDSHLNDVVVQNRDPLALAQALRQAADAIETKALAVAFDGNGAAA